MTFLAGFCGERNYADSHNCKLYYRILLPCRELQKLVSASGLVAVAEYSNKIPMNTHVVALCGSLNDDSKTKVGLREALDASEAAGATTELVDLRNYNLPLYGLEGADAGDAPKLQRTVDGADSVLLGTPVYHGSYSSPLKTALDYCSRDEFGGKTVGLLAVAGGGFPRPALAHLREVCVALDAWTLPSEVAIPRSGSNVENGRITNPGLVERIRSLGMDIVAYAGVDRYPDTSQAHQSVADD